jgi:hypothetical protein
MEKLIDTQRTKIAHQESVMRKVAHRRVRRLLRGESDLSKFFSAWKELNVANRIAGLVKSHNETKMQVLILQKKLDQAIASMQNQISTVTNLEQEVKICA